MNRRGFLSLLVAAPAVPALAKLSGLARVAPPPLPATVKLARNYVLGFGGDDLVAARSVGLYVAMPQRPFRPERFVVSAATWFELLSLDANGEPKLDEVLPSEFFSPISYGGSPKFDAVAPGESIVLAVRNTSDEARPFRAALVGSVVV